MVLTRISTRDPSGEKICMSAGRVFFDTNVLLYMYSTADPGKQARARQLYREYASAGLALLSTQVVQEFYVAALRKLRLPRPHVREISSSLLDSPLIVVGPTHIRTAMENEARYNISFWDGLILAAAASGGVELLYTEDLNDGQQYGSVLVRSPFSSASA
jgi:predicted nucleic acid-binding protein